MDTTHRIVAAAATALLAVIAPAAAATHEPAPPAEQPAEMPWPPASTHGAFVPVPEEFRPPEETLPLCGSDVTITPEDVEPAQYRALITKDGDTVVEHRGATTLDITRASDGAKLEDVLLDSTAFETYNAGVRSRAPSGTPGGGRRGDR